MTFAGAVLAGGKSSRMGRNKARLCIDGEPLWQRQMRVLKMAGAKPVFLVQAPDQRALTRGVIRDTMREAGPLAGLHAALAECGSGHLAVLAVDLPGIDHDWFACLAKLCLPGTGVVTRTRAGYEPLAAIYPREAHLEANACLAQGAFALQEFLAVLVRNRRMRVLRLKSADTRKLVNWNTPADIGRAFPVPPAGALPAQRY